MTAKEANERMNRVLINNNHLVATVYIKIQERISIASAQGFVAIGDIFGENYDCHCIDQVRSQVIELLKKDGFEIRDETILRCGYSLSWMVV